MELPLGGDLGVLCLQTPSASRSLRVSKPESFQGLESSFTRIACGVLTLSSFPLAACSGPFLYQNLSLSKVAINLKR